MKVFIPKLIQQKKFSELSKVQKKLYAKGNLKFLLLMSADVRFIIIFRYEDHNELVQKTIPKENLLVWNLKEGWEPLCKFLDVPMPDVPVPRVNVTGDFAWGNEYFYQDQIIRNGFIYFICNSVLIILVICLAIYLPLKYAWRVLK